MMQKGLVWLVLAFGLTACGQGTDAVNRDADAELSAAETQAADVVFRPGDLKADDLLDLTGKEQREPELLLPACEPGKGCFLDQCIENTDCLSGWCVEHLGDSVCTMNCEAECPAGWTCKQVGGGGPDVAFTRLDIGY